MEDFGGALALLSRQFGAIEVALPTLPHVEAEPPLRGKGTAGRLMQAIVDHACANQLVLEPRCYYARVWLQRHPEATDVLD